MPGERTAFGETLLRASPLRLLVVTAAASVLVPSTISPPAVPRSDSAASPEVWQASYSERYPGCVSSLLWPDTEKPVALVVLAADGRLARVTSSKAHRMLLAGQPLLAIGACRVVR